MAADVGSGTSPELPPTFRVMKSELPLEPHEIVYVPGVMFSVEKLCPLNVEEAGPMVEIPEVTEPVGTRMMLAAPLKPIMFPVLLVEAKLLGLVGPVGANCGDKKYQ